MTKFVELVKRFSQMEGTCKDNREKLYIKEAILLEAVPKKYKEEYCKDRGYIITPNPEELINWMREVDKRKKKKYIGTREGSRADLDKIIDDLKTDLFEKMKFDIKYRIKIVIEEM